MKDEYLRMLLTAVLAAGVAGALSACAHDPDRPKRTTSVDDSTHCVRDTGTHVQDPDRCAAGRSYSRSDIDRAAGATTAESLDRLGP